MCNIYRSLNCSRDNVWLIFVIHRYWKLPARLKHMVRHFVKFMRSFLTCFLWLNTQNEFTRLYHFLYDCATYLFHTVTTNYKQTYLHMHDPFVWSVSFFFSSFNKIITFSRLLNMTDQIITSLFCIMLSSCISAKGLWSLTSFSYNLWNFIWSFLLYIVIVRQPLKFKSQIWWNMKLLNLKN